MDQKIEHSVKFFHSYIKQNRHNRNFTVFDAIKMSAEDCDVNIFELAKELELSCYLKKKL